MWESVFKMLAEDMLFVAQSCQWQIFEGKDAQRAKPKEAQVKPNDAHMETIRGFLSMWNKGEPERADYWTGLSMLKGAQAAVMKKATCEEQEIWHPALMLKIDKLYVDVLQPVKKEFGLESSPAWTKAMARYWKGMESLCVKWWSSPPHGPSTNKTLRAQKYALAKLRWIKSLRDRKQALNLPWPTRSALEDMYEALFEIGHAVAYVSTPCLLQ